MNGHYTEHPHIASEFNTAQHQLCEVDDAVQLTNNHYKAEITTKFKHASQKYSMSICLTGGLMNKTVHKTQLKTPPTVSVWIKDSAITVLHVLDEIAGSLTVTMPTLHFRP